MLLCAVVTLALHADPAGAGPAPSASEAAGAMRPLVRRSISAIVNEGDVLDAYLNIVDLAPAAHDASASEAMFLDQSTADIAAIAGRHAEAQAAFSRMFERVGRERDVVNFEFERVETAMPLIMNEAARTRLVMINEAHHLSVHRRYAEHIARRLFSQGYTILSLEALRSDFDEPIERPLRHEDGLYTNDPALANLVRFYLDRGGVVVGHEAGQGARAAGGDRSELQALALAAQLERYPDRKVLALSGWGHISEGGRQTAARFHSLTGVNPLTIDQTAAPPELQPCGSAPRAYFGSEGVLIRQGAAARADLVIRHGRPCEAGEAFPAWVEGYERISLVSPLAPPVLVQARRPGDSEQTVPVYQRVVLAGEPAEIVVPPGAYEIQFSTVDEGTHHQQIEVRADP